MPTQSLAEVKATKDKINVVLIVLDTLRVKNMRCYGYDKPTTPNMDRIAEEGVLFENHFVPGCWTLPSHVSMFTGLYPFTHRADMEHAYLDDEYPTWAEVCHRVGYLTAAFNPNTWIRASAADRGFHVIDSCQKPKSYKHGSRLAADRFERWLSDYGAGDKPFFAFLNFGDPHLAVKPPEPFLSQFLLEGVTPEEAMAVDQDPHKPLTGQRQWTDREWAILESLSDGCVATADDRVGTVRGILESAGALDNTMLIIISDHGDIYNEHPPLMAHVMNVYDCCIHTPLIVRLPGVFDGGKRVKSLVQATDLVPTFLELVGIEQAGPLAPVQGASLVQAMDGEVRDFIYAEDPFPWNELERYRRCPSDFDGRRYYRFLKTVRDHDYKYIYSSRGDDELYFVREDIDEQDNLIDAKPDIAAKMRGDMAAWLADKPIRDLGPALNTSPIKPVTPESWRSMWIWGGAVPTNMGQTGE